MSDSQDVLVCSPRGFFPDDVHGECADCGAAVVWRPYAPADLRRVCIPCCLERVRTMSSAERAALTAHPLPESVVEAEAVRKRGLF